ncbi:MAG TPA: magnesium-translocating P-type ATPase, partial [Anaerolineales bacterium]|nr:magnesium-translocating P-type ATPase [Anaerolineales bacterium]
MSLSKTPSKAAVNPAGGNQAAISNQLIAKAREESQSVLTELESRLSGLSALEAEARLRRYGLNEIAREKRQSPLTRLVDNVRNPLVILLTALGILSYLTGDVRAMIVIFVIVLVGVVLRFFQESRADHAAEKLKAMVNTNATVVRDGKDAEVPLKLLVPGDIIRLAAGDMVPADVRVVAAKDLFLNQAALTGESVPEEKNAPPASGEISNPLDLPNVGFLGTSVESGTALAVVIHTGKQTYFGSLADSIVGQRVLTSFDKGVNKFTWLMIRFMAVMVPAVFLINGLTKHNWLEAFIFAMAVAVGLTPEMLPMIVTVNLSNGALAMARKKVIVKRLNSIQNFGAADVLCTDKTGTLTQGKIVLEKHLNVHGEPSERVLQYGYINSYFQTGLKNLMDVAVLDYGHLEEDLKVKTDYHKIDEIPFDFQRRRMSVIVEDNQKQHLLICKGAVEEIMRLSTHVEVEGKVLDVTPEHDAHRRALVQDLNAQGFRVVAVAYKVMPGSNAEPRYELQDESDMTLLGYLAFLDPPKETAPETLKRLKALNVDVKILTGDNEIITAYICKQVGMPADKILLGPQIDEMSASELAGACDVTSIFAKLVPAQKEKIVHALESKGHVVAFMGDGINDAPALKAADVGISVDSAVD